MKPSQKTDVAEFWNGRYASTAFSDYSRAPDEPIVNAALSRFGDVRGKTLVEIGCGPGASALFFGRQGANVIGVDVSSKAIDDLNAHCRANGITNVRGVCADAFGIDALPPVDFVFGAMILHHIEPFPRFVLSLRRLLKPGGIGCFYENSAMSDLLVFFRQHVVGKLWIPKYGDADEFPLTPGEVDELRKHFGVEVEYPEMLFFRLASLYLLGDRLASLTGTVDSFLYRRRWLLRYSYRQFITIRG
jgi:SAM-dependent methyltransferase